MSKWIKINDITLNVDNINYFTWTKLHDSENEGLIKLKVCFGESRYLGIIVKETLKENIETRITK